MARTAEQIAGLIRDFHSEVSGLDEDGINDVQAFLSSDPEEFGLTGKGTDATTGEIPHILINKSKEI